MEKMTTERVWEIVKILSGRIEVNTKLDDIDQAERIVGLAIAIVARYEFDCQVDK